MNTNMANMDWKSDQFRTIMTSKVAEALRELQQSGQQGINPQHNPQSLENKAFSNSQTKEDYIKMVGKIITTLKTKAQQARMQNAQQGNQFQNQQQQQQQMQMQQQRMGHPGAQMGQPQQWQQQHQQQQQQQQWDPNGGPQQRPQMMLTPEAQQRMAAVQQQQQRMAFAAQTRPGMPPGAPIQVRPGPPPGAAPVPQRPGMPPGYPMVSQAGPGGVPQQPHQQGSSQMPPHGIPISQAQQVQSPQQNYIGSPASNQMQQPSPMGAGGPRSVPSMMAAAQSPLGTPMAGGASADPDAAYRDKIRELQKYVDPLRQMIATMKDQDKQNLNKLNKLYEILTNPERKIPMNSLIKSEEVLEKLLNNKQGPGSVGDVPAPGPEVPPPGIASSGGGMNPLLASVFKLRSGEQKTQSGPGLSNTLNRVMHAPLEAILGNEITLPPLPKKMRLEPLSAMGCDPIKESSFNQDDCGPVEIPNVLQGEVARLQPQFKVSLDPAQPGSGFGVAHPVHLVCQLEDKDLPSVPPLSVTIPHNYPEKAAPICHGFTSHEEDDSEDEALEYTFTPFLQRVKDALVARLSKMPTKFSLSQLLSAWEMSVRAACNVKPTPPSGQSARSLIPTHS